jgi:SIR2-like domain
VIEAPQNDATTLPSCLLSAIAAKEGGRVVLVVGAGCSFEEPTGLPLAGECAEEAHRNLVADGLLNEGECPEPRNLSALADLVKNKRGGMQAELVSRLPTTAFKNASPNEGHKIAAALLIEGAISNIVTLNFDLALSHALATIGAGGLVSVIDGPEQHQQLGNSNVVYLHRNVNANPEELILTTDALETAWVDNWEECIAKWAMVTPVTVFVGLGSSCEVLRQAAEKLRAALGDRSRLLLANPGDRSESRFAQEMKIEDGDYVQLGWIAFMRDLGGRFHHETVTRITEACEALSQREGWIDSDTRRSTEDIEQLANGIAGLDMLSFGKVRAAWLLDSRAYPKLENGHLCSIADLLLAIGFVTRRCNLSSRIEDDGHVTFITDGSPGTRIRLIDGASGSYRWLSLETELRRQDDYRHLGRGTANRVLACGVTGRKPENATPPESIIDAGEVDNSIVCGDPTYLFWDVDEIREDDSLLREMLA